jgi:hypothetical protein
LLYLCMLELLQLLRFSILSPFSGLHFAFRASKRLFPFKNCETSGCSCFVHKA